MIFKMGDNLCSGHFTSQNKVWTSLQEILGRRLGVEVPEREDEIDTHDIIDAEKLKKDYISYTDEHDEFATRARDYGKKEMGLDDESEEDLEALNTLFMSDIQAHVEKFVGEAINVEDYFLEDDVTQVIYDFKVEGQTGCDDYVVEEDVKFILLSIYEEKYEERYNFEVLSELSGGQ